MTRQSHDQLAKQYLTELLTPLGKVETSFDVSSEARQVDIWFIPASSPPTNAPNLGLLGKMAVSSCLLEVFRNPPSAVEVRNCLLKLYSLHGDLLRKARRKKQSLKEADLPFLWILSPTVSEQFLKGFEANLVANQNWDEGVYFLPFSQKTGIVAINQLPVILDTLWLRVLGKGTTQQQAIEELVELPKGTPLQDNLLDLLGNWYTNVKLRENISNNDRELMDEFITSLFETKGTMASRRTNRDG
ncbi:MAG: hypothetical protein SAJ37_00865 [Oscillatoria sp. PMC 1068.18]|nr:hypothetical protein [Oscillatoria sp. PMC 1076.18]MEC4987272.1 hypothetical protein [Oscillatoria sp. PMC 1068.18]